jgi:hypothetical protein
MIRRILRETILLGTLEQLQNADVTGTSFLLHQKGRG